MTTILHTLWRMSFQASILIVIVLVARLLLKKYSGLYTRLLWLLVIVRLLCPVFIETNFRLLPEFAPAQVMQEMWAAVFGDGTTSGNDAVLGSGSGFGKNAVLGDGSGSKNDAVLGNGSGNDFVSGNNSSSGNASGSGNISKNPLRLGLFAANQIAEHSFADNTDHQTFAGNHGDSLFGGSLSAQKTSNPILSGIDWGTIPMGISDAGAILFLPRNYMQGTNSSLPSPQDSLQGADGTKTFVSLFQALLPALYLAGVLITAFVFFVQFLLLKRRISTAVCEDSDIWLCENITSPFVIGIFHPRIILPYHMQPEAKAHVLAHERTHIRHRDPLLHFAGILCLCLHFWNPLVWLAVHKINQDMEMFCDECTLHLAGKEQRSDYAKTLLSFAEYQSSLHAGPAFGESNTERRVKNIMKKRKKSFIVSGLIVLLIAFCIIAFMTIPKTEKAEDAPDESYTDNRGGSDKNNGTGSENPAEAMSQNTEKHLVFPISDEDVTLLQHATLFMPDFSEQSDLDAAFWKDYLFHCYSQNFDGETVNRYSKHRDMMTAYAKVSATALDTEILTLFGKALSEYIPNPQDLSEENGDVIYEDGNYYIRIPEENQYSFDDTEVTMDAGSRATTVTFFPRVVSHRYPSCKTTLSLVPAENEKGYILASKQEEAYDFTSRALTGTWAVTSYFILPNAGTNGLSQEEAEQLVGTQLKFGSDYLMAGKDTYDVDEYRKESVTAREFDDLFQLSTEEDLSLSAIAFDFYDLQITQETHPFGSQIYRFDFENAFVLYEGVLFRIVELTEDLEKRTILDDIEEAHFSLPDENGFFDASCYPLMMMPNSTIYCPDDTHYIIIKGGLSPEFDTLEKVEKFYADYRKKTLERLENGITVLPFANFLSDGMIVTYDMFGGTSHVYPRSYPKEKLEDGAFSWRYDEEDCRAVVAGFDTEQPKLYYQAAGKDWEIYPLSGFENLTEEEGESIAVRVEGTKVVVTVKRNGEEIAREVEVEG